MRDLAALPVPIATAITGHSPAGGAVLAIFTDYRVMADGPFMVGLNEVQVGLTLPPMVLRALVFTVGERQAARLGSGGYLLSPAEALRCGLVDEVVPPADVVPRALAWCTEMLSRPRGAMTATRAMARKPLVDAFDQLGAQALTAMVDGWFAPEPQATLRALVARLNRELAGVQFEEAARVSPRSAPADAGLREDIRFLGRLLGDTIREQAGAEVFELVEHIRRTAIDYRRQHDDGSLKDLEKRIGSLDQTQATHIVRAFSYFHHLANIAEDLHRPARDSARPPLALAAATSTPTRRRAASRSRCARLREAGVPSRQIVAMLERAQGRAGADRAPDRGAAQERARSPARDHRRADRERRAGWPAASRRGAGARAAPRGAAALEDQRAAAGEADGRRRDRERARLFQEHVPRGAAAPLRRPGGRAGRRRAPGAVPARGELDRRRSRRQPVRHPRRHPARGRAPGGDGHGALPGRGARARQRARACRRSTPRSRPSSPSWRRARPIARRAARDEPFRRALTGVYARLAATQQELGGGQQRVGGPLARAVGPARPYGTPAELLADLDVIAMALASDGAGPRPPRGGCATCCARSSTFGFHLAPLDLRQHSGVHARVVREIVARVDGPRRLRDACPSRSGRGCCCASW